MKKDIKNRKDIELLVNEFYKKVKADEVIGPIFTEVAKINWDKHMPRMYDFWENSLFYTGKYEGNPMELHKHLHHLMPLTADHFAQWNKLFTGTVDELFEGEIATLARKRAISISTVMQIKIIDEFSQESKIF
jgi:hemoglobin